MDNLLARKPLSIAAAITALLVLAGCAAQAPVPKDRYYRLSGPVAEETVLTALDGVLAVDRLRGNGLTQDRAVLSVRRETPNEVMPFSYDHWIDNPTGMLQQALTDYLRDSKVARQVATSDMRIRQDFILSGRIDAMEKVSGGGSLPAARLAIEFRIEDLNNDRLMLIKDYEAEIVATSDDWQEVLVAFEQAVAQIYAALRDDIAKIPAS